MTGMPVALTIDEFIDLTLSDVKEPLKSDFISKVSNVRSTVYGIDGSLEHDKNVLLSTKKLLKSVVSSGCGYADNVFAFCNHLEKLGQNMFDCSEPENEAIASSLYKFSVVHRDLANILKHLMQNMKNILVFPIETFMQGDVKSDFKKPFEKVLKDYEYKYEKLRKEKLQVMKDTGIFAPDTFTTEMIEDLDEERRRVQLEACEYFVKVNELKFKRSTDIIRHLLDFYYSQQNYFKECLSVMEHFGKTMNELVDGVNNVQLQHDNLKHRLVDTREAVRSLFMKESIQSAPTSCGQAYLSSRNYGTEKIGYLLKRSKGKVKRVWQRRRVRVGDGEFCLHHADESKPPIRLPLLTCQLKLLGESAEGAPLGESHAGSTVDNRSCFDLVSNCRTYNFQTEDDHEYEEWICTLNNALREEFQRAMKLDSGQDQTNEQSVSCMSSRLQHNNNNTADASLKTNSLGGGESLSGSETDPLESSSPATHSRDSRLSHVGNSGDVSTDLAATVTRTTKRELGTGDLGCPVISTPSRSDIQSALVNRRFGNRYCADCARPNPDWVSVNLGVLICLECCGVHRELGVHYSRTQSLTMDDLSIAQLLLPHYVGNCLFNRIFESSLPMGDPGLDENSSISQRRVFIKSKYVDRIFVAKSSTKSASSAPGSSETKDYMQQKLLLAVRTSDLSALIQVYAENFDLMTPLQVSNFNEDQVTGQTTALHIAIEQTVSWPPPDRIFQQPCGHGNLPLVEFIIQNSSLAHLQRTNSLGETALHHAVRHTRLDSLKLLLQAGGLPTPLLRTTNATGQTAYQLGLELLSSGDPKASPLGDCVHLLRLALEVSPTTTASSSSCGGNSEGGLPGGGVGDLSLLVCPTGSAVNQAARADLLRAVNSLCSVKWSLHVDKGPQGTQQSPVLHSNPVNEKIASAKRDEVSAWSPYFSRSPSLATPQFSSLTKSGIATLPRKKGFAPRPPSYPCIEERDLKRGFGAKKTAGNSGDHIDVLLDVLEEKPDAACLARTPPPVPAKPRPELMNEYYSTLPTRNPRNSVNYRKYQW